MTSVKRIFCIGRNYVEHILEMGNAPDVPPVFFSKPATSINPTPSIPSVYNGEPVDFETELIIYIGKTGSPQTNEEALALIDGISIGLDLTLRATQSYLVQNGMPWEVCKGFDRSAYFTAKVPFDPVKDDLSKLTFSCEINGELRQQGDTSLLIYPILRILCELAKYWELRPGDAIYTGSPKGIGKLYSGDKVRLTDHRGTTFDIVVE